VGEEEHKTHPLKGKTEARKLTTSFNSPNPAMDLAPAKNQKESGPWGGATTEEPK